MVYGIVSEMKLMVDDNALDCKSFKYKTKLVEKTPEKPPQPDPNQAGNQPPRPPVPALNVEVTIPLIYLSNFGRFV